MTIQQANNFLKLGFKPCLSEEGFRLIKERTFVTIDEDTFMYYSKQLTDKEKTFVVRDTKTIFSLINDGWKLEDTGLYKDGVTIHIEVGGL